MNFNKNSKKSVPCLVTRDTDFLPTGRGELMTPRAIFFEFSTITEFVFCFAEHFCGTFKAYSLLKFRRVSTVFH